MIGTVLDGKYAIESYVAMGGFGIVYRGRHLRLRKQIAIKVLRLRNDLPAETVRSIREEFEEEARLVAGLDHPAIVRVLDSGVTTFPGAEDVPWMVTEWVDGTTLASDLKERRGRGGRPPAECMRLLKPVFEALAYAHGTGVVHRDLKPANLMFTSARGEGAGRPGGVPLKLLDFGIAKVVEAPESPTTGETATQSARISFSLKYGAPEQFSGARTGPWTDIHAMALLLTEMLTDRAPYEGRSAMDLHLEALNPTRPTPGRHGVDVGPWEPVLAKALALRPSERFGSIEEFVTALEAADARHVHVATARQAPGFQSLPASAPGDGTDAGLVTTGTLPPMTSPSLVEIPSPNRRRVLVALGGVVALALLVGVAFVTPRGAERVADSSASAPTRASRPTSAPPPAPPLPPTPALTREVVHDAAVPPAVTGAPRTATASRSTTRNDAGRGSGSRRVPIL